MKIKKGRFVKIVRNNEAFWCRVKSVSKNGLLVVVDNELTHPKNSHLRYGKKLIIDASEIVDVQ